MSPVGIYFVFWHQLRANSLQFEQAVELLGPHSGFNCRKPLAYPIPSLIGNQRPA